ncbi:MAG: hypothetical protein ACKOPQ_08365 [Novosphingobium sp.]|jgi:hypothetical protein
MKIVRHAAFAAASLCLAFSAPALAQSAYPMDQGDFVEISAISVDDGHNLDYLNHVAGMWRKGQDFAKSQGWITSYEVMSNVHPRKGEPDIYLIVRFPRMTDAAEDVKRDEAYRAHMQRTVTQLETESGDRAKYRRLAGSMLLRELRFKK